jgi:hypothetical protein
MTTNTTTTLLAGILAALGTLSIAGCGQDVATCASVAALPGAGSINFTEGSCTQLQTACASPAQAADFQDYLTCLGNEGTLSATDGECVAITRLVEQECTGSTGTGTGSGTGTKSSSSSSAANQACSMLGQCCVNLPAGSAASCEAIVATGISTSCETEFTSLSTLGFCTGGTGTGGH